MKQFNRQSTIALVGASSDPQKFGHKILADLLDANYQIIPVNPKGGTILKQAVKKSLGEIKKPIDLVIFVTPPKVTNLVLQQVSQLNIKAVWFQPGSSDEQSKEYCQNHQIEFVNNACVMIERQKDLHL
jgi:predicted CoA-binding protein